MNDEDFKDIAKEALQNVISRCPPEKLGEQSGQLYQIILEISSRLCQEMLRLYHKKREQSAVADKVI